MRTGLPGGVLGARYIAVSKVDKLFAPSGVSISKRKEKNTKSKTINEQVNHTFSIKHLTAPYHLIVRTCDYCSSLNVTNEYNEGQTG